MITPVMSKDTCDDPEKDIGYYDSVSSYSIELLPSVISQLDWVIVWIEDHFPKNIRNGNN